MNNQGNTSTRPPVWEDEAPEEPRFRRVRPGVPRGLPGLPLDFGEPDEEQRRPRPRFADERLDAPKGRWWRPASSFGRVALGLAALLVLGGATAAVLVLRSYLEHDARFRIAGTGDIQATGLAEVSRADLLPVFGEDIGRNVFFVPLGERRRQLEQIPWIQQATVMRLLPDQIRVAVVERQPVAFTRQGQQIGLVDANGVLLSMPAATMARRHYSFPVVTGIDPADPLASRKARMAVYLRLMAALDSTGQHFSEQISEIDLTDPEDARVLIPEQGSDILAHFGEDHFIERYQRYKAHIAEWRQQYPRLAAVDLRYDRQVVLEMSSGTQTSTAQGADPAAAAKPPASQPQAGSPSAAGPAAGKHAQPKSAVKPPAHSSAKAKVALAKKKTAVQKRAAMRQAALARNRRSATARTRQAAHSSTHAALEEGD